MLRPAVSCQDTRTANVLTNGGSAQALPFSFNVSTHGGPRSEIQLP
jgi:hypothetical protein